MAAPSKLPIINKIQSLVLPRFFFLFSKKRQITSIASNPGHCPARRDIFKSINKICSVELHKLRYATCVMGAGAVKNPFEYASPRAAPLQPYKTDGASINC